MLAPADDSKSREVCNAGGPALHREGRGRLAAPRAACTVSHFKQPGCEGILQPSLRANGRDPLARNEEIHPPIVIPRASGGSSTPRLIGSFAGVSGILGRPVTPGCLLYTSPSPRD